VEMVTFDVFTCAQTRRQHVLRPIKSIQKKVKKKGLAVTDRQTDTSYSTRENGRDAHTYRTGYTTRYSALKELNMR